MVQSLSEKKESFLAFALALYCIYDLVLALAVVWNFTTDDAYISWLYARQLVHSNGLLWHSGLPLVEGYSNFLWIIFSALVMSLKLPLLGTIKTISCLMLFLTLFILYRLSRLLVSPLLAVLPMFIFSHYYGVIWWTVSGLESMFYCFLSVLLIWQCLCLTDKKIYTWLAINCILLLLSLTRFEGLIWVVPVGIFLLCQWRKDQFYLPTQVFFIWFFISLVCLFLPYLIYFIWRLYYFGHLIPNSYLCKHAVVGQTLVVDLDYFLVICPLFIVALPYLWVTKECKHILLWLPSVLYGLMLWQADSTIAYGLRLFLGPFALFCILPVLGSLQFLRNVKQEQWDPKLLTAFIVIILTVVFVPGNNLQFLQESVVNYQERSRNRMLLVDILNQYAQNGATVLLDDCGIIPFNARPDLRFIDALCLNNSQLSNYPFYNNLKSYAEYVDKELKPDWIITDYYPLISPGEYLMTQLEQRHFFKNYQLVSVLKLNTSIKADKGKKLPDFSYHIYKKKNLRSLTLDLKAQPSS